MDFGKIPHFAQVDFKLPDSHKITYDSLGGQPSNHFKIYLGAPVWANSNFKGKIYPEKTKPSDYLEYYSQNFQSIELNTTHYQIPSHDRVKSWLDKAQKDFKFCPKFPQSISHAAGDFSQLTSIIESFLKSLDFFGDHLGISFIQFSEYFDFSSFSYLKSFIERFPKHIPLAIELRNPCWFQDQKLSNLLFECMQKYQISTVMSDVAGRRDVLHMKLTTKKAFIRFTGNSLHKSDFERLDEWSDQIQNWRDHGLEELYFFLHQPDESLCVELAEHIAPQLQELTDFEIIAPKRLKTQKQLDLF